ncbi:hypothetical protein Ga0123461_1697 [Mariprofundus aestuarium]|uniref:SpoIIAA-like n=1 Tax=Mariprofundus aestuarium TaxID=1921086 RepID=A0A2K8KYL9_MARES|nr:hypothetical protein [Mariprofundus aestuarium]ATX80110.1 hypothetical protein Ga0123461_1697 [Mariprofundus aestuarium]
MPIERIYFEDQNFVLTLIYGKLTNSELSNHVLEMNSEYSGIEGVREVADCRYINDVSELSGRGLLTSAELEEGSSRVVHGKGAIVVASEHIYGLARMYAAIASRIRDDSRVFYSMGEALQWMEVEPIQDKIQAEISEEAYRTRGLEL